MNENFRQTADLETYVRWKVSNVFWPHLDLVSYIYQQQLMQSEALGLAYRMWRREWRGQGEQFVRMARTFLPHREVMESCSAEAHWSGRSTIVGLSLLGH